MIRFTKAPRAPAAWPGCPEFLTLIQFRPVAKGGRLIPQRLKAEAVCDIVQAHAKRLGLKAADFAAPFRPAVSSACMRMLGFWK
jgi:hypothetical protein